MTYLSQHIRDRNEVARLCQWSDGKPTLGYPHDYPNMHHIALPSGELEVAEMFDWCNENCKGGWTDCHNNADWLFDEINDAIHFKLRWYGAYRSEKRD